MYNGHKRVHAIKWQSVNAVIGIIVHLYGPVGKYFGQTIMIANYCFIDIKYLYSLNLRNLDIINAYMQFQKANVMMQPC